MRPVPLKRHFRVSGRCDPRRGRGWGLVPLREMIWDGGGAHTVGFRSLSPEKDPVKLRFAENGVTPQAGRSRQGLHGLV